MSTKGRMGRLGFGHFDLDHCETYAAQLNRVGVATQAHFDKRWSGQCGNIKHAALVRHPRECSSHGRVRQLGDDADVGADLSYAQSCFQSAYLRDLGADDGNRVRQSGLQQGVTQIGASSQMRHTPVLENAAEPAVGVVVNHDDRCPAEVQLLHNAEADTLETTHDHVVSHRHVHVRIHVRLYHVDQLALELQDEKHFYRHLACLLSAHHPLLRYPRGDGGAGAPPHRQFLSSALPIEVKPRIYRQSFRNVNVVIDDPPRVTAHLLRCMLASAFTIAHRRVASTFCFRLATAEVTGTIHFVTAAIGDEDVTENGDGQRPGLSSGSSPVGADEFHRLAPSNGLCHLLSWSATR
jgi:hypothetical protein